MPSDSPHTRQSVKVSRFTSFLVSLVALWTASAAFSFYYGLGHIRDNFLDQAATQARAAYEQEMLYRRFNSDLGGLYVPVTDKTPADVFLPPQAERHIQTPGGLRLTLINPAYMSRLVHEEPSTETGAAVRLVSRDPVSPAARPDTWEAGALEKIHGGQKEVADIQRQADGRHLRLMRPLITEASCLACHGDQGYQLGDIHGALSVSVPLDRPERPGPDSSLKFLAVSHILFWLAGLAAILAGGRHLAKWLRQRDEAEAKLRHLTDDLERMVSERTESLMLRQQQLQTFMDNTRAGVFLKDKDLNFVMVNRRFADILGTDPDRLIGTRGYLFMDNDTALAMRDLEERVVREMRTIEEEKHFQVAGGDQERTFIVSVFPVINHLGQLEGTGGTLVDLTDRHKLEMELIKAKDSAESASRAKSAFLANISHEIRTPLNGVIGMADLLLRSELTSDQASMAATVKSAGDALLVVLNDILDLSKIEAGKMNLECWPFSLRNVIFEAVRGLAPVAYTKKLEIIVNINPKTRDDFMGDQNRLRQIILNLVSNALKFTTRGEVTVTVETVDENEGQSTLRFSVKDTGIGIAPEKRQIIFEAFEQADSSITRHYGGTGLGLAISYRLADMMGAKLCLESEVGQGSTFWFDLTLPHSSESPSAWPQISASVFAGLAILFVDDSDTNRRIISEQLREWRISASSAAGVDEAVELLEAAAAIDRPFDLVLSDFQMPVKDGAALIKTLKSHPRLKDTPVILLSSVSMPEENLGELQFAATLMKPVRPEELMRAMAMALGLWDRLGRHEMNVSPEDQARPSLSSRRLKVLLTEDMEMNQVVAVKQLSTLGHQVTVASDGAQALSRIRDQHFDLIFMDIQMPVMDGLETTAHIRAMERERGWSRKPVVAMTAHALKGDREKYLSLGLDGYLSKPILIDEMSRLIEELIERFNLVGLGPGHEHFPGPQNKVTTQDMTTIIGEGNVSFGSTVLVGKKHADDDGEAITLDPEIIRMSLGGNAALVRKSMELYLRDAPDLLAGIKESLSNDRPVAAATDTHALKGISAYYTAGRLIEKTRELEKAARYSTWPDDREKLLEMADRLSGLVGELILQMEKYLAELEQ